jgi:predicted ATP-dependent endonuclease of OLD family
LWIKKFRIENYKSFNDSGMHELGRGVNVVVGQNHSGKTTLLDALSHRITGLPHRSSHLRRSQAVNPVSILDLDFAVGGAEARMT